MIRVKFSTANSQRDRESIYGSAKPDRPLRSACRWLARNGLLHESKPVYGWGMVCGVIVEMAQNEILDIDPVTSSSLQEIVAGCEGS